MMTATFPRDPEAQKTEDGLDRSTTVTRPDGSTTTWNSTLSRTPGGEGDPAAEVSPAE